MIESGSARLERLEARVSLLPADARAEADALLAELRLALADAREPGARNAAHRLLEEQSARIHAEAARQREAFLAEAGEILAGSLDYETTLASVARLSVPRVADSCVVYLVDEDERVRRLAAAHRDPEREEVLRASLEPRALAPGELSAPVGRALRSGEPELLPTLSPEDAAPWTGVLAPCSLMVVPLKTQGRTLGALSLGWDAPGSYSPDAVWLARKLADRAALAVENARLHREAHRASEVKSEFLAAMSHEFRTPLTAVLAYAELLVSGIPEPVGDAARGHAERILTAAQHLTHLVEQVLTLSRIEAERDEVRMEPTDLVALVRGTAALIEPLARQKGLELRLEMPEEAVVETDGNKVRQVLFNLLGNAVKFTSSGDVTLALRVAGGRVAFEVRDTGRGITAEEMERIWEPFWQSDRPGMKRTAGTGLGLGITRRLVRNLGGEIRARSEPGRGSVFVVQLDAGGGARPQTDHGRGE
jgi:signal transduction histidine kinase